MGAWGLGCFIISIAILAHGFIILVHLVIPLFINIALVFSRCKIGFAVASLCSHRMGLRCVNRAQQASGSGASVVASAGPHRALCAASGPHARPSVVRSSSQYVTQIKQCMCRACVAGARFRRRRRGRRSAQSATFYQVGITSAHCNVRPCFGKFN